jgi:hypothetical protein
MTMYSFLYDLSVDYLTAFYRLIILIHVYLRISTRQTLLEFRKLPKNIKKKAYKTYEVYFEEFAVFPDSQTVISLRCQRNDELLRLHCQPTGKFPRVRFTRFLCFLQQSSGGQCANR